MIHLELDIDSLDYEALVKVLLPLIRENSRKNPNNGNPLGGFFSSGASTGLVMSMLKSMPQPKRDQMAAELISKNTGLIMTKVEDFAKEQGVPLRVRRVAART